MLYRTSAGGTFRRSGPLLAGRKGPTQDDAKKRRRKQAGLFILFRFFLKEIKKEEEAKEEREPRKISKQES